MSSNHSGKYWPTSLVRNKISKIKFSKCWTFTVMVTRAAAARVFICNPKRWQQRGNLPAAAFCFQPHYWKCPDKGAAGRISAVWSGKFMRERGHKVKIKAPEASGDERQKCMKGRCTKVFNTTEIWLRKTLLVSDFSTTDLLWSRGNYVGDQIKLSHALYRNWYYFIFSFTLMGLCHECNGIQLFTLFSLCYHGCPESNLSPNK